MLFSFQVFWKNLQKEANRREKRHFSVESFPLKICFDCDMVLVIFMPEKVNNYTLIDFAYLGFIALCFGFYIISKF